MQDGPDLRGPLTHDKGADAFRAAELVGADAHEVHAGGSLGEIEPGEGLHGVGMDERPRSPLAHEDTTAPSGWSAPVSLFTSMTETSRTRLVHRGSGQGVEVDERRGCRQRSCAHPPPRHDLEHRRMLDGAAEDAPGAPSPSDEAKAPRTARLSASVPPLVNTTSPGRAPNRPASSSRAPSSARSAARATAWLPDGLPYTSARKGSIAATASAHIGVVAAWSR